MRRLVSLLTLSLVAGCSTPNIGPEPSLAPRPAEAIDPRVPIPSDVQQSSVDPALAGRLAELVGEARAAVASFDTRLADAERLAAMAGPISSEGWVLAQQALSFLIEQYGVTTRAAANIDELASSRLQGQRWIRPEDQQEIAAAAAEVAAINDRQAAAIDRLKDQLTR